MFTDMSRAGLDYSTDWSKVISDGEYVIMYKGISNQIFDAMGALALDGHMKIRVMAEDVASRNRKRFLVFVITQLDANTSCIQAEYDRKDDALDFFALMQGSFSERLVLMADMRSRFILKVHATQLIW